MLFSYKKVNDEPAVYKVDNKEVTKEEYDKAWEHRWGELDCPSREPELPKKPTPVVPDDYPCALKDNKPLREDGYKPLGTTTDGKEVYYKPVEPEAEEEFYSLEEQIIDQFMEDCFNGKTGYYADMAQLDCGTVVMSLVKKDNPKYITTMVFADEYEAAQFCFDIMQDKCEMVPKNEGEEKCDSRK